MILLPLAPGHVYNAQTNKIIFKKMLDFMHGETFLLLIS